MLFLLFIEDRSSEARRKKLESLNQESMTDKRNVTHEEVISQSQLGMKVFSPEHNRQIRMSVPVPKRRRGGIVGGPGGTGGKFRGYASQLPGKTTVFPPAAEKTSRFLRRRTAAAPGHPRVIGTFFGTLFSRRTPENANRDGRGNDLARADRFRSRGIDCFLPRHPFPRTSSAITIANDSPPKLSMSRIGELQLPRRS